MKMKVAVLFGLGLLLGGAAFAQAQGEYPRIEVPVDYSYIWFNPAHGSLLNSHSLNGGGGGFVYNPWPYFGFKADLQGYGSMSATLTIPSSPTVPGGAFARTNGNLFTYTFGPVIKVRTPRFQPFGEALFGGAHTNIYSTLFHSAGIIGVAPSTNAFAMVIGGGLDIKLSRMIQFRPFEADYLLTRFGGNQTFIRGGPFNQNSFRYAGGVNFTF
jgi:hypothetical protein